MAEHEQSGVGRKILKAGVFGLAIVGSIGFLVAAGLMLFWAFLLGMGGGEWG